MGPFRSAPSASPVPDPPDVVSAIDVIVSVVFETDNAARASRSGPRLGHD